MKGDAITGKMVTVLQGGLSKWRLRHDQFHAKRKPTIWGVMFGYVRILESSGYIQENLCFIIHVSCSQELTNSTLNLKAPERPGAWSADGPVCTFTLQNSASVFARQIFYVRLSVNNPREAGESLARHRREMTSMGGVAGFRLSSKTILFIFLGGRLNM